MIYIYILQFFFYAILGWSMEVIISLILRHRFINRGFMIGPYCPIYGVGGWLITGLLGRYENDFLVFFVMTVVLCTILEYITGYLMEKIFHARWWDYSDKPFNLNGRVCLQTCIGFGVVGVAVIYVGNPIFFKLVGMVPVIITKILAIIGAVIFFTDLAVSIEVMSNIKKVRYTKKDNTEEITKHVKKALSEKNFITRRLVNAFPNFELIRRKTKETIENTKKEIRKKQKQIQKMRRNLKKNEKQLNKMNKKGRA